MEKSEKKEESLFDEEFTKLQDFISLLCQDSIKVDFTTSKTDPQATITQLINQNKFYAKKIITLFENLENFYKDEKPDRPDSNLQEKLHEYEQIIEQLQLDLNSS